MLGEQEAHGRGRAGREIVVERLNRHATLAATRELADLDGRLGIAGDQQLVFRLCGFLANALDLVEDGVGLGDFFLT